MSIAAITGTNLRRSYYRMKLAIIDDKRLRNKKSKRLWEVPLLEINPLQSVIIFL